MESQLAEIEFVESVCAWIVHTPGGNTIQFTLFMSAHEYCRKRGWDIMVVESPWDEEVTEWH